MRDAATLLLVRDTAAGLEVFMVERPGAADFGGMHVFPGGKVDAADSNVESLCTDLTDSLASERLGIARNGLAFWTAAIREAFEEAGVLLGYRDNHVVDLSDPEARDRFADHRLIPREADRLLKLHECIPAGFFYIFWHMVRLIRRRRVFLETVSENADAIKLQIAHELHQIVKFLIRFAGITDNERRANRQIWHGSAHFLNRFVAPFDICRTAHPQQCFAAAVL